MHGQLGRQLVVLMQSEIAKVGNPMLEFQTQDEKKIKLEKIKEGLPMLFSHGNMFLLSCH